MDPSLSLLVLLAVTISFMFCYDQTWLDLLFAFFLSFFLFILPLYILQGAFFFGPLFCALGFFCVVALVCLLLFIVLIYIYSHTHCDFAFFSLINCISISLKLLDVWQLVLIFRYGFRLFGCSNLLFVNE